MNKIAISDAKANRLYWLGRYTERAYLSLHMYVVILICT